jgi:hypothetical protein
MIAALKAWNARAGTESRVLESQEREYEVLRKAGMPEQCARPVAAILAADVVLFEAHGRGCGSLTRARRRSGMRPRYLENRRRVL